MRLVPLTTKIVRPTSCAQPSNVDVLVGDVAFQLQRILDKTCISEYWMMRSTPDREKANMVAGPFKVTLNSRADTPITVSIPCAVNSTKVHSGDELMVYKPAVQVQTKIKSVTMNMEVTSKKQKLA